MSTRTRGNSTIGSGQRSCCCSHPPRHLPSFRRSSMSDQNTSQTGNQQRPGLDQNPRPRQDNQQGLKSEDRDTNQSQGQSPQSGSQPGKDAGTRGAPEND